MSGKGRGRGWLKLDKSVDIKPGSLPVQPTVDMSQIIPQYEKFISVISQYSSSDDGIMVNQKYKYTVDLFLNECKTKNDVEEVFNYIYQRALQDQVFAAKLVLFTSLNSFREFRACDLRLRDLWLNKMQQDFENAQKLRETNINSFYNAIFIMGNFFDKATMAISNNPYIILSGPLLMYLNMLLDAAQPEDIELFTAQLFLNGAKIQEAGQSNAIIELNIKVRNLLISDKPLKEVSKVWLLLAIDISNNEYRLLPSGLLNYYQNKLGDKAMGNLQKSLSALSIQTLHPSAKLENYKSDVNVLQVDLAPPINDIPHNYSENTPPPIYNTSANKEDEYTDYSNWQDHQSNDINNQKVKTGRPILGAGARKGNKVDDNKSWRDQDQCKENAAGWETKQKNTEGSGWGGDKQGPQRGPRSNKGWEHDDRFETDYN